MPETLPQHETIPNKDGLDKSELLSEFSASEQELILRLKVKGDKDPEVSALLDSWTKNEKGKLAKLSRAYIEFSLKRAKIYYLAGFKKEALGELDAADYFASQIGEKDLQEKAIGLMKKIQ